VCHFVIAMLILSSNRPKRMATWMWADSIPGRQVTSIHTLSAVLSALQLTWPADNFTDHKVRYELRRLQIKPDLHSKAVRWNSIGSRRLRSKSAKILLIWPKFSLIHFHLCGEASHFERNWLSVFSFIPQSVLRQVHTLFQSQFP
jgi:hypothetical protein